MQRLVQHEHPIYFSYCKVVGYTYDRCTGAPIPKFEWFKYVWCTVFFVYFTNLFVEQSVHLRDYVIKHLRRHMSTFRSMLDKVVLFFIILIIIAI